MVFLQVCMQQPVLTRDSVHVRTQLFMSIPKHDFSPRIMPVSLLLPPPVGVSEDVYTGLYRLVVSCGRGVHLPVYQCEAFYTAAHPGESAHAYSSGITTSQYNFEKRLKQARKNGLVAGLNQSVAGSNLLLLDDIFGHEIFFWLAEVLNRLADLVSSC